MVNTTANASAILVENDIDALLVVPALDGSVVGQVTRRVQIASHSLRLPRVLTDPSAAFVAEGAEIPISDANLDEVVTTPSKCAGLTVITRELADDSSPAAASVVGAGLARDISRTLDKAFFGNLAAPNPKGLASLTGAGGATAVAAPSAWANNDPFEAAIFAAADVEAKLTSWCMNPADALALSQLKEAEGSNKHLLQPDPTAATRRVIAGLPVYTSPAITAGTVWGIPEDRVVLVVRDEASIDVDRSIFFTSDRVAIRATLRVGIAFPHPQAVVRITRASA
jgi:HK97 family phage major capsid protein